MHVTVEPLPYFLVLLQKNVLLCSIIATGSFANIDLGKVDHRSHSDQALDLFNFNLNKEEVFPVVNVTLIESGTTITFHTLDSKYFDHPEVYFGRLEPERMSGPYIINGIKAQTRKKNLGKFTVLGSEVPPASVVIRHSSLYGYVIAVSFYKHDLPNSTLK